MNPILYAENETAFTSQGVGVLSDTIACKVTEERNGTYELTMQYPISGIHYENIRYSMILAVDLINSRQYFRIYSITKPINGIVTIDAEHISYELAYIAVAPFSAVSAGTALQGLKDNAMSDCPFTFWTDIITQANYIQPKPDNIRARLAGQQGSILDLYGGEYEFDNYNVKLWNHRGTDRGVVLRYGKNITDIKQEENIASTYTSIVGYWYNEDSNTLIKTDRIDSEYASAYPYKRTAVIDFSDEYKNAPTKAQLTTRATGYMTANGFGVPDVNIEVSFVQLWQTEEYKTIAPLERVYMCDTITIEFEKLGISAQARVIKTVWDVLLERYDSVQIGNARSNMSSRTVQTEVALSTKVSGNALTKAIDNATEKITGDAGGYVVINHNADGEPFEILIMDTDDIATAQNVWRWNQSGWGHSSTGYDGQYTLAATLDGGIVADFITAGTITGIAINNGNGSFRVDAAGNVTIGKGSININNGVFKVDSNGAMKSTSGEFIGAIKSGSTITCGTKFSVDAAGNVKATNLQAETVTSSGNVTFNATDTANGGIYTNANVYAARNVTAAANVTAAQGNIYAKGSVTAETGNLFVGGQGTVQGQGFVYGQLTIGSDTYGHPHRVVIDTANGYTRPMSDGSDAGHGSYLGSSAYRWNTVYAVNGLIDISDRNHKKNIKELDERYLMLFDKLMPVSYMFTYPNSDRVHIGFISQDVEEAMSECGLTALDFGGFCKDVLTEYDDEAQEYIPVLDEHGNLQYIYSLRYDEFIALNTAAIKRLMARIERLEERYEQADD